MLFLDEGKVGAPAAHLLGQPAHRAARDQVPADELQKARKLGVAGRLGDRAVQRQVLVDRRFSARGGTLDGITTDIYSEGIQMPIVKAYRKGVVSDEIMDIIRMNVRLPERAEHP